MLKKLSGVLLVGLVFLPAMAQAQDAKKQAPTLVVRVRSFDEVVKNIKVLAKAVDKEEVGNQLEQMIKAQTGPKGLEGVDTKRPLGLYAKMGVDLSEISAVLMIPISNEKAFLKLLENLNYKASKNPNGVYVVDQFDVPVDIGFRFANGYAYVTGLNLDAIDKGKLLKPAAIFPLNITAMVSATLRMDQIPKALKDVAIAKIEEELAKEKNKPAKNEAEKIARNAVIDTYSEVLVDFLYGATEVTKTLDVDAKEKKITASLFVDSKRNSRFHATIADLAKSPSLFGGMIQDNAAVSGLVHYLLPKKLRGAVNDLLEKEIAKAIQNENNPQKRRQAEMILKAIDPTLKAGELDGGVFVEVGKDGQVTVVGGVKVKDGMTIEKAARDLLKDAAPGDRQKIKLDVAKVAGANIHELDIQDEYKGEAKKMFGNTPLLIAVRADAIYYALGKDGMKALRTALTTKAKVAPVVHLSAELGQFAQFFDKDRDREAAKKIFGKGEKGHVRLSVQGGKALTVRFEMSLSVLRFGVEVSNRAAAEVRLDRPVARAVETIER